MTIDAILNELKGVVQVDVEMYLEKKGFCKHEFKSLNSLPFIKFSIEDTKFSGSLIKMFIDKVKNYIDSLGEFPGRRVFAWGEGSPYAEYKDNKVIVSGEIFFGNPVDSSFVQ